jgi:hypothetical protein
LTRQIESGKTKDVRLPVFKVPVLRGKDVHLVASLDQSPSEKSDRGHHSADSRFVGVAENNDADISSLVSFT